MSRAEVVELDVMVDGDQVVDGGAANIILEAVRPNWDLSQVKYKVFTAGIANRCIGCYLSSDREWRDLVMLRLFGANTDLVIDRGLERANMQILHAAGCAPHLYCSFQNGLAYGFARGVCVDAASVRDEHIGRLIARELVRVNAIDPDTYRDQIHPAVISKESCLFPKMRTYLESVPDSFANPEKDARFKKNIPAKSVLNDQVNLLEEALLALNSPVVFCHNDLLLNNIVFNKEEDRCAFIDFEYGAFTYEAYDIAGHFCEWAGVEEVDFSRYPDRATQCTWLQHFLAEKHALSGDTAPINDGCVNNLYLTVNKFALAAHLFWGIWALIQARYSLIDFDYMEYAELRLGEYFKRRDEFLALDMPNWE